MKTVTVRNNSNDLVLLGDQYLYPSAARTVPVVYFEAAEKAYPGALAIESEEEPQPAPAPEPPAEEQPAAMTTADEALPEKVSSRRKK